MFSLKPKIGLAVAAALVASSIVAQAPAYATNVTATGTAASICNQLVGSTTGVTAQRVGNDCIITFTNVGSTTWQVPSYLAAVDVLVVGGGGGGGGDGGSGGGGGESRRGTADSVTAGGTVTVTVGGGGSGGSWFSSTLGTNGGASSLSGADLTYTANGGVGGPGWGSTTGGAGGSGGTGGTGTNGQRGGGGPGGCSPVGVLYFGSSLTGSAYQDSISSASRSYGGGGGGGLGAQTNNGLTAQLGVAGGGTNNGGRGSNYKLAVDGVTPIDGASAGQAGFNGTGGGGGAGSACDARGAMNQGFDGVSQRTAGGNGGSGVVIVRYTIPTYSVTWDSNSGSSVSQGSFLAGGTVSEPTAPTRSGRIFAGWSTSETSNQGNFNNRITSWPYNPGVNSNITLYAIWITVAPPTGVTATPGGQSITVAWTEPSTNVAEPPTAYRVEYSTTGTGTWTLADGAISSTARSYEITGLSSSTAYYVRVAAVYSGVVGTYGYPWTLIFESTTPNRVSNAITYTSTNGLTGNNDIDLTRSDFSRVRYYVGAKYSAGDSSRRFVDANFDKNITNAVAGAETYDSLLRLQVPLTTGATSSQFELHGNVSDLVVLSSESTVTGGHGLSGRLEIWPWDYATAPETELTGGSRNSNTYDDGDSWTTSAGSYGSFQLHDIGASPYTIFAWNRQYDLASEIEIGFGNNSSFGTNVDWTFATDNVSYTSRSDFLFQSYANLSVTPLATYQVSYNSNSATSGSAPSSQTKIHGINLTLASNSGTLARTGYDFAGWNTQANGSGTSYAAGATYSLNQALSLFAQWTANTLNVTWDTQGGSNISGTTTVTGGSISSSPGAPTRSGFVFKGWFAGASGGNAISFPYTHNQTGNFTLYAQWDAIDYTLSSPASNNVAFARNAIGQTFKMIHKSGNLVSLTVAGIRGRSPSNVVCVKAYIYTSTAKTTLLGESTNTLCDNDSSGTETSGLEAPGSFSFSPISLVGGTTYFFELRPTTAATFWTSHGYFPSGGSYPDGALFTDNQLKPEYDNVFRLEFINSTTLGYQIFYDRNNSTGGSAPGSQLKTAGQSVQIAANDGALARTNFVFGGWNTQADGLGTNYSAGDTYNLDADLTLFAKWNSANADLSGLSISQGTLSPTFNANTISYTASVANSITSMTVTPTRSNSQATITVNGTSVTSGSASGAINLSVGSNTITIVVTAGTGATKTYTVTVTRANPPSITPTFDSPTRTVDGFIVSVSNYLTDGNNTTYQWSVTASSGTVSLNATTGLITVTGLASAASSTVTVTTSRSGYVDATATRSSQALTKLSTPTSLAVTAVSGAATAVTISFNTVVSGSSYAIQIFDGSGNQVGSNYSTVNSGFVISDLLAATTYSAKIFAVGNGTTHSNSDVSAGVSFTTGTSMFLSLSGSGQSANRSATIIPSTGGTWTFEAWISPTHTTVKQPVIFSQGTSTNSNRIYLKLDTADRLVVYQDGGTGEAYCSTNAIPKIVWTHVAISVSNSQATCYVNGVAQGSAFTLGNSTIGSTFYLGAYAPGPTMQTHQFAGGIDEVKIWSTARTQSQISNNQELAPATSDANLIAYYPFDSVSGTSAISTKGSLTLTLSGSWLPLIRTITYEAGTGGSGSTQTASSPSDHTTALTIKTLAESSGFTRSGFSLNGWNTLANGSGTAFSFGSSYAGAQSLTLHGQWVGASFTVTYAYNSADGGNSTATSSFTTGGTAITLPTPTRTGFAFAGWHSDIGLTTLVGNAGASYSPTSSLTLYAKWNSTNADLSGLTISQGTLSSTFSSSTTSYTASVANNITSMTVTPTRSDSGATITVNGSAVTSGSASGNINLNVGSNTITIVVTAASGATKTYTVTVTVANNSALNPTFATPTPTADGFTVAIANYTTDSNNTNYTWAVSASPGTATLNNSTGLVTVTGVNPNTSSTLTVTTTRSLYNNGSATVSGTSLATCSPTTDTTSSPGYTILKFESVGACNWSVPVGVTVVDSLVVGGGGGGSGNITGPSNGWLVSSSGAGGAGGVYPANGVPVSGNIRIFVGAGGQGGSSTSDNTNRLGAAGTQGQSSALGQLTAGGGGGGGCETTTTNNQPCASSSINGLDGTAAGNGGSPSNWFNAYNWGNPGSASSAIISGTTFPAINGFRGGIYVVGSSVNNSSGSGGGAGSAGSFNAPGAGVASSITGSSVTYGRGGLAWNATGHANTNAAANTGNGGNGAYNTSAATRGSNGGSGIVIVRYANTYTVTYAYNSADGGNSTATSSFTTGGTAITLPTPTRTGFAFAGWHSDIGLTTLVGNAGASYSPTSSLTLYAKWNSTNADLSGLTISQGTLSSTFSSSTTSYTASVANNITSMTVTPTRSDSGATITVNGSAVTSGSASGNINLNVGSNTITIVVTAASGATKTYTVTVTRAVATYNVLYDEKGGSTVNDGTFTAGGVVSFPTSPTRAGFTFVGWAATDGGTAVSIPYSPGVTNDITMYAVWTANTNTITWDSNSGSSVSSPSSFTTGGTISQPTSPTRTGKIFIGWSTSETSNQGDSNNRITSWPYSPTSTSNLTLFAIWADELMVYESFAGAGSTGDGGGTGFAANWALVPADEGRTASDSISHQNTTPRRNLVPPANVGFAVPTNSNSARGAAAQPNRLYYNGRQLSTPISFDSNGTYYMSFMSLDESFSPNWGSAMAGLLSGLPSSRNDSGPFSLMFGATRPGQFGIDYGNASKATWVEGVNRGTSNTYSALSTRASRDSSYTAFFVVVKIVTRASGNDQMFLKAFAPSEIVPMDDSSISSWDVTFETAITGSATHFAVETNNMGYIDEARIGYTYNSVTDAREVFTVTLDSNGGTSAAAANFVVGGTGLTLPTVTRTGFTFGGWFEAANFSGSALTTPYSPTQTRTLYARWTANTYNVTYDEKGGSTVNDGTFVTGGTVSFPTSPTRSGYTFVGWSATDGGTTPVSTPYSPGVMSNITLYAIWSSTLTITTPSSGLSGSTGESFSLTISTSGGSGSNSFTVGGTLPTGLSINSSSGVISGTPTVSGNSSITVTVTDSSGAARTTNSFTIAIALSTCSPTTDTTSTPGYTILKFESVGSCSWSAVAGVSNYAVLLVAGGGGGGDSTTNSTGGRGGAGGYFSSANVAISGSVTIQVGAGGVGSTTTTGIGGQGGDTALGNLVVGGGGGGASFNASSAASAGRGSSSHLSGGGGGGSRRANLSSGNGAGGAFASGGVVFQSQTFTGHAGVAGGFATDAGSGGTGGSISQGSRTSSLTGSSVVYAKPGTYLPWTNLTNSDRPQTFGSGGSANYTYNGSQGADPAAGGDGAQGTVVIRYANTYTVTYNYNSADGGNSTLTSSFTSGGTAITLPVPTRTGYTFDGWYEAENLSGSALGSTYSPTQSRTIYAKWSLASLTVTFNANDGSGNPSTSTQSITHSVATALTANAFSRTGYTFAGWNTLANGNGVNYTNQQSVTLTGGITLYAKWTANTYTITYAYDGADGGTRPATNDFTVGGTAITLPTPTKTGYTFGGWFAEVGLSTSVGSAGASYSPSATGTIYAKWTANTNTVTFKSNYTGGPNDTTQSITSGTSTALTANAFTRAGYTFNGWNTLADGTGTNYTNSQNVTILGALTLYAKWAAGTYTVTYNYNSATGGNSVASGSYTTGGPNLVLPTPTRTGYTFAGWYDDSGFTGNALASSISTTNSKTIYAKWTAATYTVLYAYNSATGGNTTESATFTTGGTAITPPTPTRTGYNFVGWFEASDFSGSAVSSSYTTTQNRTLYAKWNPVNYTVTYNANLVVSGNTISPSSGSVPTNNTNYNIGQSFSVAANTGSLARNGYTFGGWVTNQDGSGTAKNSGETITFGAANINLYPKWTPNTYSISYNLNGGSGSLSSAPTSWTVGDSNVTLPSSGFTRTGFNFDGWAKTQGGSVINNSFNNIGDVTLYAVWSLKSISYSFDKGTAAGLTIANWPSNSSANFGTNITLPNLSGTTVTISGDSYLFFGWTSSSSTFQPGSTFTLGETSPTFTAEWVRLFDVRYGYAGGTHSVAGDTDDECNTGGLCTSNQQITLRSAPSRAGYTFNGWRVQDSNTTKAAGAGHTVIATQYLFYARWTAIDYDFSFNSMGGSDSHGSVTGNIGQVVTMPNPGTRAGYTFAGWSPDSGTTKYSVGSSFTVGTQSRSFVAYWTPNVYTVVYDWQGASGTPTPDASYTVGTGNLSLPTVGDRTRDGYTFAGWAESPGGTVLTSFQPTSNDVLYAVWNDGNFTLSYDGKGGNVGSGNGTVRRTQSINLPTPVRAGFVFNGWYDSASGGNKIGNGGQSVTPERSKSLFARWTQKSLSGVDLATLENTNEYTASDSTGVDTTLTHTPSGTSAQIKIPTGTLPNGTKVNVQYFRDTARQSNLIPGENSYFFAVLVSWLTGTGDSATVPNTNAGKSIEVTLNNNSIKAGAMAYMVLGTEVRELGRATQDGTITVQLTEDPEIVVAATAPASPASVVASSGSQQATVSWAAPSNNGGAQITGYTVTASPGGATCTTSSTSCTVTGLTNGTAYTFSVVATNSVGNSSGASSSSVTPASVTYTVTFNSNGGSNVSNGSFTSGGSVSEPTAPSRSGFTFEGWSTGLNNAATKVTFPYTPGVTSNITLYALWTQVQQGGGGSGGSSGGSGGGSGPVVTPSPTPGPSAPPSQIGFVPTPPATPVTQTGPVGAVRDSGERVSFAADQQNQTLIASAGSMKLEVRPPVTQTVNEPVTEKLELLLPVASQAQISGTGLQPNTVVEAWVFSQPRYLGTIKVGSNGSFDSTLVLPKDLLPGKHTLQLGTVNSSGRLVTLSMPITIKGSVSVGTFRGFIAIYSTALEGQEITAKVAGKWIRQNPVTRFKKFPYSRLVRFTGAGYNINIDVYINKKFYKRFTTRTR